jgi:hypothetical protein
MLPNIIILSVILMSIAVLLIFRKNISHKIFSYLIIYLCTNLCFEILAFSLLQKNKDNIFIYNLEMFFEVSFFLFLYRKMGFSLLYQKTVSYILLLLWASIIINVRFFQPLSIFNSNIYTLGSFLLLFVCGFYLLYIIKNDEKNPLHFVMFWISLGLLFCYLGNLPFLTNVNRLFAIDEQMALRLRLISITVNVLMYCLIAIGVICNR